MVGTKALQKEGMKINSKEERRKEEAKLAHSPQKARINQRSH